MSPTTRRRTSAYYREIREQAERLGHRARTRTRTTEHAAWDAGHRAYRRALRNGDDHETAEIAANTAQAAYQARNGDPSDPLTKAARQRTTFQRRADAAVRKGLNPFAMVHPVEVARAHRPTSPAASASPTAHARTAPQRRESRTASATNSSGSSGGDDDPDSGEGDDRPAHAVRSGPRATNPFPASPGAASASGTAPSGRLADALALHALGLHLIPLAGKRPNIPALAAEYGRNADGEVEWWPLREHRATAVEVSHWSAHDPQTNIGIIPAPLPDGGDLVALDIDDLEGWRALGIELPPTWTVLTDRGYHAYFRAPTGTVRGKYKIEHNGETVADVFGPGGNYCVAPPSVSEGEHHGQPYEYEREWLNRPDEVPLANLPDALLSLRPDTPANPRVPSTTGGSMYPSPRGSSANDPAAVMAAVGKHLTGRTLKIHEGEFGAERTSDFRCVLPDHLDDRRPSANLYRAEDADGNRTGAVRYGCRAASCKANLSLGSLAATLATGSVVSFPDGQASSAAVWRARLLHEVGVAPVAVPPVVVPSGLPPAARRVAKGYALLSAIRRSIGFDDAIPWTRTFAAPWCSIGERQAGNAIRELRDSGWLKVAERSRARRGWLYQSVSEGALMDPAGMPS